MNRLIDSSWEEILNHSISHIDRAYLNNLSGYFPENYLCPFLLPKEKTKYILFGQDPYPRLQSACGYAFIDSAVKSIWSQKGLSKEVNRATSLRNFIKMLLLADGFDILDIPSIDKSNFIDSIFEFRDNFLSFGVLLLNIVPIFTKKEDFKIHLKYWRAFLKPFLDSLDSDVELILFGNFAQDEISKLNINLKSHNFEHPYNLSFINNSDAHNLFKPMRLLYK